MKTFFNIFGSVLIALGIIAASGAAGDCDGKCMDNALTLSEMLAWFGYGLAAITTAICIHPISR